MSINGPAKYQSPYRQLDNRKRGHEANNWTVELTKAGTGKNLKSIWQPVYTVHKNRQRIRPRQTITWRMLKRRQEQIEIIHQSKLLA